MYSGTSSLINALTSLNGRVLSGSLTANSTPSTIYTASSGVQGFVFAQALPSNNSMMLAWFCNSGAVNSLTILAKNGNSSASVLTGAGSFSGTVNIGLTQTSGAIQVTTTVSGTVNWIILLL
jgi:hypothetical protein